MGLYVTTAFFEALSQARHWRPDVIHAHFVVPTGALAWVVSRMAGVRYVVTAHLGDVPGGVPEQTSGLFRYVKPFARLFWRGAGARTAISSFVGSLAETAFGTPPDVVIPNGIPAIPPQVVAARDVPEILMVGRLSVQKNPLLAAEALALVPAAVNWRLRVIGKGPLEEDFRRALGARGLLDRVEFCGWLSEDAVRARMAAADLLLLPSLHEGLPMAAVEALWHGLAIVGSKIGGLRDVVRDGLNGSLCELRAPDFASALTALLSDREWLLAARGESLKLAGAFDFEKSVTAYEAILADQARRR